MAWKAHRHLLEHNGIEPSDEIVDRAIGHTATYNRVIGNTYTASLYLALLDHAGDLSAAAIGLFSYGSGNVAEFFSATVVPGYRAHLRSGANRERLAARVPIEYERYAQLHDARIPADGGDHPILAETAGPFRLAAISDHKRIYEIN